MFSYAVNSSNCIIFFIITIIITISFFGTTEEFRTVDYMGNGCQTFHGITGNIHLLVNINL
jgi:hypothetical protein